MHRHVISGLVFAWLGAVSGMSAADVPGYPAAERGPTVDVLHGTEVSDPYRWMEQDSPELAAWVKAENAVAEPYLNAIPARESLKKRLTELWNYEQYGYSWLDDKSRMPVKKGGRYFYVEKSGSQNQGILYWAPSLDAAPKVIVDPNALSADATASLADYSISPDGRFVAYAVSDGGTDWDTWHVREVESGRDLPDLIGDTKFTARFKEVLEGVGNEFVVTPYPGAQLLRLRRTLRALDSVQAPEAHDLLQALGVEGVHVDVHAGEPGGAQGRRELGQQYGVAGHGHVLHAGHGGDLVDSGHGLFGLDLDDDHRLPIRVRHHLTDIPALEVGVAPPQGASPSARGRILHDRDRGAHLVRRGHPGQHDALGPAVEGVGDLFVGQHRHPDDRREAQPSTGSAQLGDRFVGEDPVLVVNDGPVKPRIDQRLSDRRLADLRNHRADREVSLGEAPEQPVRGNDRHGYNLG